MTATGATRQRPFPRPKKRLSFLLAHGFFPVRDIEAGRNVRGLPEDLVHTMLEHAGHKVDLGDDFDEDADI